MARAIWSGSISFGLVNIPIKLYNAVSRKGVSFHQIDSRTGARVKMQRVSSADGSEVPYDAIVKGFELSPERYVLIEPEELDSLDPEATHTIDIEEFVDLVDIDPIYYDTPYYLAPVKGAEKSYALLERAMEEQGKVAIARFVMRTKQYLAALRAGDGRIVLSTMAYADEVSTADDLSELQALAGVTVSDREVTMASQLIQSLSADFEPKRFRDTYRDQVMDLITRKASGEEVVIEAPKAVDDGKVIDLMSALEASVREARETRRRHPTGTAGGPVAVPDEPDDEVDASVDATSGDDGAADGVAPGPVRRRPTKATKEVAAAEAPAEKAAKAKAAPVKKKAPAKRARKSA